MTPLPDLVVPLRVPAKYRYGWPAISVCVVALSLGWIVLERSWEAIAYGSVAIASFAWIWGSMLALRRARGDTPAGIVLTGEGIRSPWFSLDWERVASVRIGATSAQAGGHHALFVEPMRPEDVRWAKSAALGANRWISRLTGQTGLRFLQVNIDMPLEQLANEMEARAGRPLAALGPYEALDARH